LAHTNLTAPNKYQNITNRFTRLASDPVALANGCVAGAGKQAMNQARALGEWWYSVLRTPIHKFYTSDLKRAHSTAVQLVAPRASLPDADKDPLSCPPIHTTPLIREQHSGIAEGKRWSAGSVSKRKQQQQRGRAPRTMTTRSAVSRG